MILYNSRVHRHNLLTLIHKNECPLTPSWRDNFAYRWQGKSMKSASSRKSNKFSILPPVTGKIPWVEKIPPLNFYSLYFSSWPGPRIQKIILASYRHSPSGKERLFKQKGWYPSFVFPDGPLPLGLLIKKKWVEQRWIWGRQLAWGGKVLPYSSLSLLKERKGTRGHEQMKGELIWSQKLLGRIIWSVTWVEVWTAELKDFPSVMRKRETLEKGASMFRFKYHFFRLFGLP